METRNEQPNITPDFESQSSAVNDDGFSLGSYGCSSKFFLFFSNYAPYVR